MAFKKGQSGNPNGRKHGSTNKITKTVKETVLAAFNDLQDDPKANILQWGKDNPTEFYKVASKLIPTEIQGSGAFKFVIAPKEQGEDDADNTT